MQKTILVVDDDTDVRHALMDFLGLLNGFKILQASSGEEALSVLKNNHADVVISDIRMPNGDGEFLIQNLQDRIKQGLVFAFMTGYADLSRDRAIGLGATGIFYKPFDLEQLTGFVSKHLH